VAVFNSFLNRRGDEGNFRSKKIKTNVSELVSFTIGEEEYGIEILRVQEIVRLPEIIKLPNSYQFIKGIINLRGNITPILDLREQFGLEERKYEVTSRAIVVKIKEKFIGLATDSVSHVIRINQEDIEPAPPVIKGIAGRYVKGVGKYQNRFIILLDIDQLLTSQELKILRNISEKTVIPDKNATKAKK
jgi:purine-binding chemotaxis protein CheW